jgi:hypothetical protein
MWILLLTFTACLAVAWAIPMLDGLDAGRHLAIFNFLLDLLVCGEAGFLTHRFLTHRWIQPGSTAGSRRQ